MHHPGRAAVEGPSGLGRTAAPPRIPRAMTSTTPIPIRTSPMLKTLAAGIQVGIAKMSVRGRSAGSATTTLLENPAAASTPDARDRLRDRPA